MKEYYKNKEHNMNEKDNIFNVEYYLNVNSTNKMLELDLNGYKIEPLRNNSKSRFIFYNCVDNDVTITKMFIVDYQAEEMSQKLSGGNNNNNFMYMKYMKYKNKYLKLKKYNMIEK